VLFRGDLLSSFSPSTITIAPTRSLGRMAQEGEGAGGGGSGGAISPPSIRTFPGAFLPTTSYQTAPPPAPSTPPMTVVAAEPPPSELPPEEQSPEESADQPPPAAANPASSESPVSPQTWIDPGAATEAVTLPTAPMAPMAPTTAIHDKKQWVILGVLAAATATGAYLLLRRR
jgi:hypothetical protein